MGRNLGVLFAVMVLFLSSTPASAEFYRWTDKDGKEFFTNELSKIPPEYQSGAAKVVTDETRVSVGKQPPSAAKSVTAAADHKDKNGRGEEWWRRRATNLRRQLSDLQDEYDLIVKQEKDDADKPRKLTASKKKSVASRNKKKAQLEKKIAKAKRRLESDLPEEARKADAYPGWVRE